MNTVTVEVPYGFQCSANCFPTCTFTWTRGGLTTQGPELNLQLKEQVPPQVLICMAINPTTGKSVTVSKTVNVTGRLLIISFYQSKQIFRNHTMPTDVMLLSLCTAHAKFAELCSTLSNLIHPRTIIYFLPGPSNIKITGPDTLSSGVTSNFSCSADCYPSCFYTWTISFEAQSTVTTKYGQTICHT